MMREYKRYDDYKDSGIEWIGEIPKEWAIKRGKFIFKNKKDKAGRKAKETQRLSLSYAGIKPKSKTNNEGLQPSSFEGYQLIEKNDLVFKLIDLENTTTSRIGFSNYNGMVSPAYIRLTRNKDNKYYYYFFYSLYIMEVFNKLGGDGVRSSLNATDLLEIELLEPNFKLQQKIASFLDQKTAEIDEIITKKEKLIDYLEKYKKSVITEAVTKGKLGDKYINEDGELVDEIKMKDSGVEWIDEMPKYCEPIRLKYVLDKIEYGLSESSSGNGEYKILTMGNISDGKISLPEKGSLDNIGQDYLLKNKDLLFNRTNSMEQIAKVGIFRGNKKDKVTFASYLVRLVPNKNNNNEFINYMLNNYKFLDYAKSYAIPSINQANLNPTRYTNLSIIRFPLGTQQSLVEKINLKTKQIEEIIQKTRKSIGKYKEYKKSLIFEAVTGKIDLRSYQIKGGEKFADHNNSREAERKELSEVN